MKTKLLVLAFWFVVQSESGQLLAIGPFASADRCNVVAESVVDAKVIVPCYSKIDPGIGMFSPKFQ